MTTPCTKIHYIGKTPSFDEFRQYGQAIAWLEWESDYILISKMEAVLQARQGAAKQLVEFLKSLADKYHVRLFGHAVVYSPDPPVPVGDLLNQKQLEDWYVRRGFQLRRIRGTDKSAIWYPEAPPA